MIGIRGKENIEFQRFFIKVQEKAASMECVFFLDSGLGHVEKTVSLEAEDLIGWLIPAKKVAEFNHIFVHDRNTDLWEQYIRFVDYEVINAEEDQIEITITE